jgi:hypothetical protein
MSFASVSFRANLRRVNGLSNADVQPAEQIAFLGLMLLHPQEHVVQESHGGEHAGTRSSSGT